MLERSSIKESISDALRRSRIVALIGPRQCGKTTLAQEFLSPDSANYFDLEDPVSLARLDEPKTALEPLQDLVVIDEIQRRPELFPILRVLADRKPNPARFLILGSASPELLRQSSESLAGRMETIELTGFKLKEVGAERSPLHWLRGGFPLSFLAENEKDSFAWRRNFIATFLERDLPSFGVGVSSVTMNRFWTMLAHYHGQIWNASEIAGSMNVTAVTTKRYLDVLTSTFMIRQLQPWHENLGKRQVKAPKVYFRDSGIFHTLAGIRTEADLFTHPKLGASWEGYAIEESIRHFEPDQAYFWATHGGAELDLLLFKDGKRIGIECKRQDAPKLTPSMKIAIEDLKLDELRVIYPGSKSYPLAEHIKVEPLASLADG
ncbi:ATP-binding protein [Prosthecobacter sp. SYSU 5D2]|uniref:ATP-binding protein n=1 Tax=Prosthecobacter sp. SYSU 5D2 TaxID=3134134 RepID=UPI0031FE4A23